MRDTIVSMIGTSRESRKGEWPPASRIGGLMSTSSPEGPTLERRFGLLQSTALNMSNMIGVGPFITIPLLMSAMGGPQALAGWLVALVIVIADGFVWSELGSMMPGSGGTYRYLAKDSEGNPGA